MAPYLLTSIRKFLTSLDFFSQSPTLRAHSSADVQNTFGGCVTICMLGLFCYIFITQMMSVINWEQITSTIVQKRTETGKKLDQNLMFAVGVTGTNLASIGQYFRYHFYQQIKTGNSNNIIKIPLETEPCTISHFANISQQYELNYQNYAMYDKVCLKPGQSFSIMQPSIETYSSLHIVLDPCNRLDFQDPNRFPMYSGCQYPYQFGLFLNSLSVEQNSVPVHIVLMNTFINQTSINPIITYLDLASSAMTQNRGTTVNVKLSPYQITTDQSIWPISTFNNQTGFLVDTVQASYFQNGYYYQIAHFKVQLSPKSYQITRSIGKIDVVLSYAGGIFQLIFAVIAFFLLSFNGYRYEIIVGEGAFNYSEDGKKIREQDFTFFFYIVYSIFDWIKTLTCCEPNWKFSKQVDQTRDQANNQLDVKTLLRKLQHFEKVHHYLLGQKQRVGLFLTEPPSIEEVSRQRRISEYYDKVIQGKQAVTVEDIKGSQTNLMKSQPLQQSSKIEILHTISEEDLENVELDSEDEKLELKIAEAFFKMDDNARKKIQEKVPIKIIERLKFRMSKEQQNKREPHPINESISQGNTSGFFSIFSLNSKQPKIEPEINYKNKSNAPVKRTKEDESLKKQGTGLRVQYKDKRKDEETFESIRI